MKVLFLTILFLISIIGFSQDTIVTNICKFECKIIYISKRFIEVQIDNGTEFIQLNSKIKRIYISPESMRFLRKNEEDTKVLDFLIFNFIY